MASIGTWLAIPAALVVAGLYKAPHTTKNALKVRIAVLFLVRPDISVLHSIPDMEHWDWSA
jgi:hypothetical protein